MKPLYSKVIINDFSEHTNNCPIKFKFVPIQNTNNYNNFKKWINSNDVQFPIICFDNRWFDYIKEEIIPTYNLVDKSGHITVCEFDYINTIPIELHLEICIWATDISELAELEEYIQSFYNKKRLLSVEHPNKQEQMLNFEISLRTTHKVKRSQKDIGNEHVYLSSIFLIGSNCVSFTETYSDAQLELDSDAKNDIIERLAALEDIKAVILQKNNSFDNDKTAMIDKSWAELDSLIDCVKGITTYRKLYDTMNNHNCNAGDALSLIQDEQAKEEKRAQEEARRIQDLEKKFSKKGDKVLNQYTDAVIENIKSKWNNNFPLHIYGGSTFTDWYKLDALKMLEYPNILVKTDFNYTFSNKQYTNINADGKSVIHDYTQHALPAEYGFRIQIRGENQKQVEQIDDWLREYYTEETQVCIPDPTMEGEVIPIRLIIDMEKSAKQDFYDDINGDCSVFQAIITFQKMASVYYPIEYVFTDVIDDQQVQFRLLQQAEFFILCDSKIRYEALKQLDTDYKNLLTANQKKSIFDSLLNAVGSAFDSPEYKALKTCFKNGQPIDRNLFNKALSKITDVYPLYDKMAHGWTPEQIHDDLSKYADFFNSRWNSICNTLTVLSCPLMLKQLGMSGDKNMPLEKIHKGLVFYINKMFDDPYCTMCDAYAQYDKQLAYEAEQAQIAREQRELERESSGNNSGGGFLSSMLSNAGGGVIGNKMSGNSPRNDEKKDLFGTPLCKYGQKGPNGWTIHCDLSCPLKYRCTHR